MDAKSLTVSALTALAPVWPAATALLTLLESAQYRKDACEVVLKLIAQAALAAQNRTQTAQFIRAQQAVTNLRDTEAAQRASDL